jgi:hypothetical protein
VRALEAMRGNYYLLQSTLERSMRNPGVQNLKISAPHKIVRLKKEILCPVVSVYSS